MAARKLPPILGACLFAACLTGPLSACGDPDRDRNSSGDSPTPLDDAGGTGSPGTGGTGNVGSPDAGSQGGSGGSGGTGGSGGGGGSGAMGGMGGSVAIIDAGCVFGDTSMLDFSNFQACGSCGGNAHCIPRNLLMSQEQADLLLDCDADNECVPDLLIATVGRFLLPTCESLGGAEGRCVSTCVPRVAQQIDMLPRDVCGEHERCAPCYDPITGEATGSCTQGCDEGPVEAPYRFAECCGGISVCVPDALVPVDQRDLLGADSCAATGELCAPKAMASDPSAVPASCMSLLDAEGRCLPSCLPDIAAQADRLPIAGCGTGHLCAPCYDPVTGASTGACEIASDAPTQAPKLFDGCCDDGSGVDLGACVPSAFVPADQVALLDADTCTGTGVLCAPKDLASGGYVPESCDFWGVAEARCLPACLPDVRARASQLERGTCDQGKLCVPCFDPLTGADTGACTLEGDQPTDPGPYEFPTCCDDGTGNDLGTCVPSALVPADQVALLDAETCTDPGFLCAPTTIANDAYTPMTCVSLLDAEGRCLPACLPDVAEQAAALPSAGCPQGHLCAPCYDPFTGNSSGACEIDDDVPVEDPVLFPGCCDDGLGADLGSCVPIALVSAEQQALLGPDTCSTGNLCAPKEIAAGDYAPQGCASWNGAEGRCLPACLPDVAAQASQLTRDQCDQGELCVPCYDPLTGADTGSCRLEGDQPTSPTPYRFPTCCDDGVAPQSGSADDLGTCVPSALVDPAQRAMLNADTCTEPGALCAPTAIALGTYQPQSCNSWDGAEGRCLPMCLPDVAARAAMLTQDVCDDGEGCVPCYDPLTGEDTGACRLESDAPADPPYTFPTCCDDGTGMDLGTCVPSALVAPAQQSMLSADTCTEPGALCAPTSIAQGAYAPQDCDSWNGAEGRCLPACLPDIAAQASRLTRDVCDQGELCAPCYDPLTGEDTGSCFLEGDTASEPPYTFPTCCDDGVLPQQGSADDLGTCVPSALVDPAQQSMLSADTCSEPGALCAPTSIAQGTYAPQDCNSWGGGEGRCLPACLPDVAAQASQLTIDVCDDGELCVPCYDPLTGADTGSCRLEGDAPVDPAPYRFPTCCDDGVTPQQGSADDLGTCVPAVLAGDNASLLDANTCTGGFLCAPTALANGTYQPQTCSSWLDAEGRCLPACLPAIAAQASQLTRDVCDQGELCVPCFDPVSGTDTGSCRLEGDAPANPTPETFPTCCPSPSSTSPHRGTCVPAQAAGAQASSLPNLNCETLTGDADDYVCAPTVEVVNPAQMFPSCTTVCTGDLFVCLFGGIGGQPGACIPSCFLSEQVAQSILGNFNVDTLYGQSSCAAGEDCGPCTYPSDPDGTGPLQAGGSTGLCN